MQIIYYLSLLSTAFQVSCAPASTQNQEGLLSIPVVWGENAEKFEVFMVFDLEPKTETILINGAAAEVTEGQVLKVPAFTSIHTHQLIVDVLVTVISLGDGAYLIKEEVVGMGEMEMTVTQPFPISQKLTLADDGVVRGAPCHHDDVHLDGDDFDATIPDSATLPSLKESSVHFVDNNDADSMDEQVEEPASLSCSFYSYLARFLDFAIFVCLTILFFNIISYMLSAFFGASEDDEEECCDADGYQVVSTFAVDNISSEMKKAAMEKKELYPLPPNEDLPAYTAPK